jgi:phosphopantothenoylcysteine synthetase/decarboxylase
MNLLLGVTGGIAAYKSVDLVSRANKVGLSVRVIMTPAGTEFVTPLTFEAISGNPVLTTLFTTGGQSGPSPIEHIAWAKWADVACIAPLTASTIGKLACGIADNLLTTIWMALPAHVPNLICPAMNTAMWENPIVQRNLSWLDETGRFTVVPPVHKRLACGDEGVGGMADPADILSAIQEAVSGSPDD